MQNIWHNGEGIKLLWKAPVLHGSVLKVLSDTCTLELQKQV